MSDLTVSGTLYIGSDMSNPDTIISDNSGIPTSFNNNRENIDFKVLGTGNHGLYFDASTGRIGIGTGIPDAALHVVTPCSQDGLIVESVTNCPTGVTLLLIHNPQIVPATGGYPAIINLAGRNTNYQEVNYAQIKSHILNPLTGFTSGEIVFSVDVTGALSEVFAASPRNIVLGVSNNISGHDYSVIGNNNSFNGLNYIHIGKYSSGINSSGTILGNNTFISGYRILGLINNGSLVGNTSIILGDTVAMTGSNNIAIGNSNTISGLNNILVGNNNISTGNLVLGILTNSLNSGVSGISIGSNITNAGHRNIYIGHSNNLTGNNNSIIGSEISTSGNNDLVFGNRNTIVGNNLMCFGSNQSINLINSGIFIGNSIALEEANRSIVMGLGNANSGLDNSILVGISNLMALGDQDSIIMMGQSNIGRDISNSIVIGNSNNVSGQVFNSTVFGNQNALSSNSTNNLVIGSLNHQTGVYIDSDGNITGVPRRVNQDSTNSIAIGINNIFNSGIANIGLGNKNAVSGSDNTNIVGSYNRIQRSSKVFGIGNSNYVVGDNMDIMGNNIKAIGQNSIIINPSNEITNVFGSGNIVLGNNSVISSGIVVGNNNAADGINNLVYGRNNKLGYARHSCIFDAYVTNIIKVNSLVSSFYPDGSYVLLTVTNPSSKNNQRIAQVATTVENPTDLQPNTIISLAEIITIENSNAYDVVNNTFDENNQPVSQPYGFIMPYQRTEGDGGTERREIYGSSNIIIGNNNRHIYSSGIIIGSNNNISGVNNTVLGRNLSGVFSDSLIIGTSNANKVILDDQMIVFNSGKIQDNFIIKSSSGNLSVVNIDLATNSVGINTDYPDANAALSVSGILRTEAFRLGYSTENQYVLTSNINGYGTWQLPVRISGSEGCLLYYPSGTDYKVASGISGVSYNNITRSFKFNLGTDSPDGLIINPTGMFLNDGGYTYNFRIRGSGETFSRVLLETDYSQHRINFFNISGNSGVLSGLNISNSVGLPRSLVSGLLRVETDGSLKTFVSRPNTVFFSAANQWASGNTKLRWFDDIGSLALGSGELPLPVAGNPTDSWNPNNYNLILSTRTGLYNGTVFNKNRANSPFSILSSGTISNSTSHIDSDNDIGFHFNPQSGQVMINGKMIDTTQAHLRVNGLTWTNGLRLFGGSATAGQYLRVDSEGVVSAQNLDLNTQFSGIYPLRIVTQGTNFVTASFSTLRSNNQPMSMEDDGSLHSFRHSTASWALARNLKIYQTPNNLYQNNAIPYGLRGTEFGYMAKVPRTVGTHAFAGGGYRGGDNNPVDVDLFDGSSQVVRYYLRGRTRNAVMNSRLVTDWAENLVSANNEDGDELYTNSISLEPFYTRDDTNNTLAMEDCHRVWQYTINASVLVESNTVGSGPKIKTHAGNYIIEGAIARTRNPDGSWVFQKLRNADGSDGETVKYRGLNLSNPSSSNVGLAGVTISGVIDNTPNANILSLRVGGPSTHNCIWSAIVDIHQLNWPTGVNIYPTNLS